MPLTTVLLNKHASPELLHRFITHETALTYVKDGSPEARQLMRNVLSLELWKSSHVTSNPQMLRDLENAAALCAAAEAEKAKGQPSQA